MGWKVKSPALLQMQYNCNSTIDLLLLQFQNSVVQISKVKSPVPTQFKENCANFKMIKLQNPSH